LPIEKLKFQNTGAPTGCTVTGTFPLSETVNENVALPPAVTLADEGPIRVLRTLAEAGIAIDSVVPRLPELTVTVAEAVACPTTPWYVPEAVAVSVYLPTGRATVRVAPVETFVIT
jgi:hypothetical protein